MSNIKYKIEFFTDWHCGSGLSSGADLDLLVIKDKDRLPFVPGKTIKGLVREVVEEILDLGAKNTESAKDLICVFGEEGKSQGCAFFTNAELPEDTRNAIIKDKLQDHLYRSVASTAIDDNGIAKEQSLRKMEITVPCIIEGAILDVPEDFAAPIEDGLKFIKRLGQNRNRGLGRCSISIIKEGGNQ